MAVALWVIGAVVVLAVLAVSAAYDAARVLAEDLDDGRDERGVL